MKEIYQGQKLCVFIGENDKYEGRVLYEQLLEIALECGLSGGTVIRGSEGFGAHGEIHTAKILRLADDLPIILEFIGRSNKIDCFVARVSSTIEEGLMTRTNVEITKFRKDSEG